MPVSCQSITVTAFISSQVDSMNVVDTIDSPEFPLSPPKGEGYGARFNNVTLNLGSTDHTAVIVDVLYIHD